MLLLRLVSVLTSHAALLVLIRTLTLAVLIVGVALAAALCPERTRPPSSE